MKLLRATIRNYRVHRELTVEFESGVTAIAAPNEYGKSTLLEAIHRALFLKHRTGGEIRRAMGSRHGGHPEIEVHFEVGGARWRLRKLFATQSGQCELTDETSGRTWKSDEAEAQLARLVGREPVGSNRKELDAAWDHLWVWQGKAGGDPLQTAGAEALERVLQGAIGEAEALVAGDAHVLELLRERVDATWTKSRDATKKDSEASRAAAKIEELQQQLEVATARRAERANQSEQLADARRSLAIARKAKTENAALLEPCETKHSELDRLRLQQESATRERDRIAKELKQLDAWAKDAQDKRAALDPAVAAEAQARAEAAAKSVALAHARRLRDGADGRAKAAELAAMRARDAATAARIARDLAEKEALAKGLRADADAFAAKKRAVDEAQAAFDASLAIAEADVAELQRREKALQSVRDRLAGVAVRLARTAGSSQVFVDGLPLETGASLHVTEVAELRFADGSVIEVRPGGGELQALRQQLATAEAELREELLRLGVADVEAARAARVRRADLAAKVEQATALLRGTRDPESELQKLPGVVERLARELAQFGSRGIEVDPAAAPEELQRLAERTEGSLQTLREAAVTAAEAVRGAEGEHERAGARLHEAELELQKARTELEQCNRLVGDAQAFDARRLALRDQVAKEAELGAASARRLAELPLVTAQLADLRKQEKALESQIATTEGKEQLLEEQLQGEHAEDLDAVIEEVQARIARQQRAATDARARADGEKLLLGLLEGMQKEQRARREAPFVAACDRYLAIAHGPGIRSALQGDDRRGLGRIDRSSVGLGAFDFDELSQGGQELTALAVRLAMAEVLAKEQPDRILPLVLDDAVTNVDPERLRSVGFLLAEAARNGVQVVFATCDVERAPGLRADRLVPLPRPSWGSSTPVAVEGD